MAKKTWQKDVILSFIVLCEDHGDVLNLALALRLNEEGQAAVLREFLGARTYNRIEKEQAMDREAKPSPRNKPPRLKCSSCLRDPAVSNGQCAGCAHKYRYGDRLSV